MSRLVHIDQLRTQDPLTLEILTADALRRPITQLSAATVAGLCALSEVETISKSFRRELLAFANRASNELADLPNGESIDNFIGDLALLAASHVPETLRRLLSREAHALTRPETQRIKIQSLNQVLAETPAESIRLGGGKPTIFRSGEASFEQSKIRAATAPRLPASQRPERPEGEERTRAPSVPRAAPTRYVDTERANWIADKVLDRLADHYDQGLREEVLVAGVRHRAKAKYPDLSGDEVIGALRALQNEGRAKQSAGRWRRIA